MKKMIKAFNEYMKKAKQESARQYSVPAAQTSDETFSQGWIGVDLDGTLANSERSFTLAKIGEPVPKMAELVRSMVKSGVRVKIFTARAGDTEQVQLVKTWLRTNGFPDFEVTNVKDYDMIRLYDDRAVQVIANTGEIVEGPRS
ncbi:hypothetical protein HRM2_25630 [Desulforapulum autotrophicum HRM2]|uniref:Uncharacterized protein n=2 Tax=Desulforapulum autotrophicum TaxID=2296 RepID=C0QH08_DESAH|nr:hypothetical protein HRM2_25630 [Desulforapulum autotrophicum HRM2]